MNNPLEPYFRISRAAGVSIRIAAGGHLRVAACLVTVKGSRLEFGQKRAGLGSAEELTAFLPAGMVLALNLTGKGVLTRRVEGTAGASPENLALVLPNADLDDFYVQAFVSGEHSFISVIRKTEADRHLAVLRQLGYQPLMLSLGPFPLERIAGQLNLYGEEIVFDGHRVERDGSGNWLNYRYQEDSISPFILKAENEPLPEALVLPYAAAFQLVLYRGADTVWAGVSSLNNILDEKLKDKRSQVYGALFLGLVFMVLMVNLLLLMTLRSENTRLADQLSRTEESSSDAQHTDRQIRREEDLLRVLGWDGGKNKAVYIDQLAQLLPAAVVLKQISINPADPVASRAARAVQFRDHVIRVTGTARQILPVNEWMARVRTKSWVKNIRLDNYQYDNDLDTGTFVILIDF